ncbi:universal stress protein [Haloarchaeobius sp. HRN-SO-5]|uniref:universal stress protein n=1 Tax=Haloarchaeobius sp. HRN-SO-5 TaxID=3446118 RepID=UPI003EBE6955
MEARVLVPFDGTPLSKHALEHAMETFPDAALTTIYVIDPMDSVIDVEVGGLPVAEEWYENAQARATDVQAIATELAAERGRELDTVTAVGRPVREVLDYADERDVSHIVLGSHGREGVERALLGSVAERVVRRARVPVTVVR